MPLSFVAFMINFICLFSVDCVQHIIAGRTEYLFRHRFWSILIYNLHCFFDHIWRVLWLFHLQKHSGCHLECTFDQSYIDVSDFDLDHLQFCGKSWCQYLFLLCFFRVCVFALSLSLPSFIVEMIIVGLSCLQGLLKPNLWEGPCWKPPYPTWLQM